MARAERTLTCLWGHWLGLCTVLSLSLSLSCSCSLSLSLTHCCPLSLSSSSTGQRSSCRWSWLSWNCRATFPVVLATSCSISCLMTALLQDYWGCEDSLPSGCPALHEHAGVYGWCICCHKYISMIQVRSFPSAEMSRLCKVGRNPSVGKVNCVWMGELSGVRNILGAVSLPAVALCGTVLFYKLFVTLGYVIVQMMTSEDIVFALCWSYCWFTLCSGQPGWTFPESYANAGATVL